MARIVVALCVALLVPVLAAAQAGALVAVGGGGTTPEIVAKTLEISGGKAATVVVLPQSSAVEGAGQSSVKMWLEAGAKEAAIVSFTQPDAETALRRATLIWIPGGDQNRFMKAIENLAPAFNLPSGTPFYRRLDLTDLPALHQPHR